MKADELLQSIIAPAKPASKTCNELTTAINRSKNIDNCRTLQVLQTKPERRRNHSPVSHNCGKKGHIAEVCKSPPTKPGDEKEPLYNSSKVKVVKRNNAVKQPL